MKLFLAFGAVVGLGIFIALTGFYGFGEIATAIGGVGWGLLAVVAFHLLQLVFSSLAWQALILGPTTPRFIVVAGLRWIREAVNNLLPVAQIGGEVVGARLLQRAGVPLSAGGGSVTVDLTMEMVSQIIFTLLALALLIPLLHDATFVRWTIVGIIGATAIVVACISVQRLGLFRLIETALIRLAQKTGWSFLGDLAGLDLAIQTIYRNPARLGLACGNHLISWLLGGFEVMLALYLVGVSVDFREGLIIEALGQALRAVGFAVPASLGVQEGGYVLICGLLGISPQAAIELSLMKRIREIALGVPALVVWQTIEGRRLFAHMKAKPMVPAVADGD